MKKDEPLLKFPCEFNLKVMGENNEEFEAAVLSVFRKQKIKLREDAIFLRQSSNHKYLSMTITFTAKSKKQMDKLYQALHNCRNVVMTL